MQSKTEPEKNTLALMPYHRFAVDGRRYAVTIDRLRCTRLDDETHAFLAAWEADPSLVPADDIRKSLDGAGLLPLSTGQAPLDEAAQIERDRRSAERFVASDSARTTALCLMVAQECNMACVYCYGNEGKYGGGGLMTEETARRSIDWLIKNSGGNKELSLSFFGGEPLLNLPVIRSTVAYARKAGEETGKSFSFYMTTNASLANEEVIDFLKANDFGLLISFDGTPEAQNSQRPFKDGSPSYPVVAAKIKRLLSVFPKTNGRATLYGDEDPAAVLAAMKEMGFHGCQLVPAAGCLLTEGSSPEAHFRREQDRASDLQRSAAAFVAAVKRRDPEEASLLLKDTALLSGAIASGNAPVIVRRLFYCQVGRGYLAVDVDGGLYPCHRFVGTEEYRLGNVLEGESPDRGLFHESAVVKSGECRQCWARYRCGGGCTYENVSATGNPFQPSPASCQQFRRKLETQLDAGAQLNEDDLEFLYQHNVAARPPCPLDF